MKRKSLRKMYTGILLIAFLVITTIVGSVIAHYIKRTEPVVNEFKPAASVMPGVDEDFKDKTVKKNVSFEVGDTGYPVFVRVAIVVTWKKADGTAYYKKPEAGTDYMILLNGMNWEKIESTVPGEDFDYYYLKTKVESGGTTPVLIYSCTPIGEAPAEGYTLSVDLIVQTVQAIGYTDEDDPNDPDDVIPAYKDAWGISETLGTTGTQEPEITPKPDDSQDP